MNNQPISLQQLLLERADTFAASDRPREIIDAAVEAMFKEVIKDAFRSYGDLGRAVQDAVKAAMPSNVSDMFELTRYNALIANALRQQWESSGVEGDMLRRANEAMSDALKDDVIPDRVSLREILQLFVDENKDDAAQHQWRRPEIRFCESEYGGMQIFFDPEPETPHRSDPFSRERSEWSLKHRICVNWDPRKPELDESGRHIGPVYSAQIDKKPIGRDFAIRTRWERLIAALYFGGAKLVIDCDPDDFSYGIYD
ncbi:MAG: hypothetical protein CVT61_08935 [Actinobacteria bacterium HGW-Actinobacteria-11]|nr:MAG: hypothetical protein CVT61_08935 [Actinobacteria bacterium HGW-Actinobacteria-11]